MCSSETKPQPARPILIFAIEDASSGRRSIAKAERRLQIEPAMTDAMSPLGPELTGVL